MILLQYRVYINPKLSHKQNQLLKQNIIQSNYTNNHEISNMSLLITYLNIVYYNFKLK